MFFDLAHNVPPIGMTIDENFFYFGSHVIRRGTKRRYAGQAGEEPPSFTTPDHIRKIVDDWNENCAELGCMHLIQHLHDLYMCSKWQWSRYHVVELVGLVPVIMRVRLNLDTRNAVQRSILQRAEADRDTSSRYNTFDRLTVLMHGAAISSFVYETGVRMKINVRTMRQVNNCIHLLCVMFKMIEFEFEGIAITRIVLVQGEAMHERMAHVYRELVSFPIQYIGGLFGDAEWGRIIVTCNVHPIHKALPDQSDEIEESQRMDNIPGQLPTFIPYMSCGMLLNDSDAEVGLCAHSCSDNDSSDQETSSGEDNEKEESDDLDDTNDGVADGVDDDGDDYDIHGGELDVD